MKSMSLSTSFASNYNFFIDDDDGAFIAGYTNANPAPDPITTPIKRIVYTSANYDITAGVPKPIDYTPLLTVTGDFENDISDFGLSYYDQPMLPSYVQHGSTFRISPVAGIFNNDYYNIDDLMVVSDPESTPTDRFTTRINRSSDRENVIQIHGNAPILLSNIAYQDSRIFAPKYSRMGASEYTFNDGSDGNIGATWKFVMSNPGITAVSFNNVYVNNTFITGDPLVINTYNPGDTIGVTKVDSGRYMVTFTNGYVIPG